MYVWAVACGMRHVACGHAAGWVQLTPQGRSYGVDCSFYDPRDRAVTLAVFTKSACALGENCGSGCSCDGDDRRGQGMNASLCIGCTCKKEDNVNFYCDSN